jgi:hypothetical protein
VASGYLDLAYRELQHGSVLNKMKQIREKMSKDEELQERINKIKEDSSLARNAVEGDYKKLIAITKCDDVNSDDCSETDNNLCQAWKYNKGYYKYFVKNVLTGRGLVRVNTSIFCALLTLLFATVFPHIALGFSPVLWWILFIVLVVTIFIPMHLLYMSEQVGNMLIGKNGKKGLIEELEIHFNASYNQYLKEKATGDFI